MKKSVVVDDSKLERFKKLVDIIDYKLEGHPYYNNIWKYFYFRFNDWNHYYDLSIFKKYIKNPFVKVLIEHFALPHIDKDSEETTIVSELSDLTEHDFRDINRSYRLVFWLLFTAAIDDDFYNNELSTVTDLATQYGFDEAMIRDFCHVIECILIGNIFNKTCKLKMETSAGSYFFRKFIR